jgi:hypothetical protein
LNLFEFDPKFQKYRIFRWALIFFIPELKTLGAVAMEIKNEIFESMEMRGIEPRASRMQNKLYHLSYIPTTSNKM